MSGFDSFHESPFRAFTESPMNARMTTVTPPGSPYIVIGPALTEPYIRVCAINESGGVDWTAPWPPPPQYPGYYDRMQDHCRLHRLPSGEMLADPGFAGIAAPISLNRISADGLTAENIGGSFYPSFSCLALVTQGINVLPNTLWCVNWSLGVGYANGIDLFGAMRYYDFMSDQFAPWQDMVTLSNDHVVAMGDGWFGATRVGLADLRDDIWAGNTVWGNTECGRNYRGQVAPFNRNGVQLAANSSDMLAVGGLSGAGVANTGLVNGLTGVSVWLVDLTHSLGNRVEAVVDIDDDDNVYFAVNPVTDVGGSSWKLAQYDPVGAQVWSIDTTPSPIPYNQMLTSIHVAAGIVHLGAIEQLPGYTYMRIIKRYQASNGAYLGQTAVPVLDDFSAGIPPRIRAFDFLLN